MRAEGDLEGARCLLVDSCKGHVIVDLRLPRSQQFTPSRNVIRAIARMLTQSETVVAHSPCVLHGDRAKATQYELHLLAEWLRQRESASLEVDVALGELL